MSHNDWDLDELLNFDYGDKHSATGPRATSGPSSNNEAQLYAETKQSNAAAEAAKRAEYEAARQAEIRRRAAEANQREEMQRRAALEAERQQELRRREEYEAARQAEIRRRAVEAARQEEARRQAAYEAARQEEARRQAAYDAARQEQARRQEENLKLQAMESAYQRYQASANDGKKFSDRENRKAEARAAAKAVNAGKKAKKTVKAGTKATKLGKILAVLFTIATAAFAISMTIMNVLPFKMLISMYVVLGLLCIIFVALLKKNNLQKWARRTTSVIAFLLIVVYGVGSAYAMGTLSFLNSTSVENDNRVANLTTDPFNVIMTGMDVYGPVETQGRSDVNMIVTVNPETETILLTSIPRDYEVRMPDKGYSTDKLTHTGFYSVDTTIQAEEDLLQFDANYYVKVNFSTVRYFIDNIGGIDVYSDFDFVPEKCPECHVKKGMNHLDGQEALAFARERHSFAAGDNQRIKNQQAVFEAMLKKATSAKTMALRYSKLLSSLGKYFEMSFSSSEIRSLVKLQLANGPKWKIYKNTLTGNGATKPTYTTGSQEVYVTEADPNSVAHARKLMQAVMDGKKLAKDDNGVVYIEGEEAPATTQESTEAQTE